MTIQQVIDLAKASELSGLSVSSNDNIVLSYLNLGMIELYKRFTLKVEEYIIELVEGQDIYTLPENFMWIVAAYGEVPISSTENVNVLPVNEEDNPISINTVSWNTLQIPNSINGSYVSIIYVASPTYYTIDDLTSTIELPIQMIECLIAYIGYKANSSIDSGVQTEDNVWYARFEASCLNLEKRGMVNANDMYMNGRIEYRGFV